MPKSKPVAHTMMSNSRSPSVVSMPVSVTRTIGVSPEVDERDLRVVERLVVAGHERRSLLAEAVVLRDQLLRRRRVLDDAADLVGDELAPLGVGRVVEQQVGVVARELREARALPHRLEERLPLLGSESSKVARSLAGWRKPVTDVFSISRIASKSARSCACSSGVIGALLSGVHQLAVRWYTVSEATSSAMTGTICTPLDPVPMTATRLPAKSTGVGRPQTGVVRLAAEVLAPGHVREERHREHAGRGDEEPRPELGAVVGHHGPGRRTARRRWPR